MTPFCVGFAIGAVAVAVASVAFSWIALEIMDGAEASF